eukprot:TRINITY_DN6274_c0_g1_i3.p1 TRINITY_DN6274_c0_g1~~TRINITY_DN6274_c0_g1_i3.p1  ORF type:complete len:637 (+),score=121.24 TRINITY_DN6274_c0_g1_i3:76-1911(+)
MPLCLLRRPGHPGAAPAAAPPGEQPAPTPEGASPLWWEWDLFVEAVEVDAELLGLEGGCAPGDLFQLAASQCGRVGPCSQPAPAPGGSRIPFRWPLRLWERVTPDADGGDSHGCRPRILSLVLSRIRAPSTPADCADSDAPSGSAVPLAEEVGGVGIPLTRFLPRYEHEGAVIGSADMGSGDPGGSKRLRFRFTLTGITVTVTARGARRLSVAEAQQAAECRRLQQGGMQRLRRGSSGGASWRGSPLRSASARMRPLVSARSAGTGATRSAFAEAAAAAGVCASAASTQPNSPTTPGAAPSPRREPTTPVAAPAVAPPEIIGSLPPVLSLGPPPPPAPCPVPVVDALDSAAAAELDAVRRELQAARALAAEHQVQAEHLRAELLRLREEARPPAAAAPPQPRPTTPRGDEQRALQAALAEAQECIRALRQRLSEAERQAAVSASTGDARCRMREIYEASGGAISQRRMCSPERPQHPGNNQQMKRPTPSVHTRSPRCPAGSQRGSGTPGTRRCRGRSPTTVRRRRSSRAGAGLRSQRSPQRQAPPPPPPPPPMPLPAPASVVRPSSLRARYERPASAEGIMAAMRRSGSQRGLISCSQWLPEPRLSSSLIG